jgi:creatinine amidohydrolase/Fe(II)-dependent formamide hydrolase-like protein
VIIPGGILEEHCPYLPSGSDGIYNLRLADDIARAIASRPGWTTLLLPHIPVGAATANEIGRKFVFTLMKYAVDRSKIDGAQIVIRVLEPADRFT